MANTKHDVQAIRILARACADENYARVARRSSPDPSLTMAVDGELGKRRSAQPPMGLPFSRLLVISPAQIIVRARD